MKQRCCIYCRIDGQQTEQNQRAMEWQLDALRTAAAALDLIVTSEIAVFESGTSPLRQSIKTLIRDMSQGSLITRIGLTMMPSPKKVVISQILFQVNSPDMQKRQYRCGIAASIISSSKMSAMHRGHWGFAHPARHPGRPEGHFRLPCPGSRVPSHRCP